MTILYLSFKEIESQGEKKKEREKERIGKQEKREFSDDRENRMKKYEKNKKKKKREEGMRNGHVKLEGTKKERWNEIEYT